MINKTNKGDSMETLKNKDYMEIVDMNTLELIKYSKKELIEALSQLANELYEMETACKND